MQKEFREYTMFTPLNVSKMKVLNIAKKIEKLQWLARLSTHPSRRDKAWFCTFHGDHGHDIEECRHLKMEIERLIRWALQQLIKKNNEDRKEKEPQIKVWRSLEENRRVSFGCGEDYQFCDSTIKDKNQGKSFTNEIKLF